MYQLHPNARTTPAVRAAIALSAEPSAGLCALRREADGVNEAVEDRVRGFHDLRVGS